MSKDVQEREPIDWRDIVPANSDMAKTLSADSMVVEMPHGFFVCEPDQPCADPGEDPLRYAGALMEFFDKQGRWVTDLAYFSQLRDPDTDADQDDYCLRTCKLHDFDGQWVDSLRFSPTDIAKVFAEDIEGTDASVGEVRDGQKREEPSWQGLIVTLTEIDIKWCDTGEIRRNLLVCDCELSLPKRFDERVFFTGLSRETVTAAAALGDKATINNEFSIVSVGDSWQEEIDGEGYGHEVPSSRVKTNHMRSMNRSAS